MKPEIKALLEHVQTPEYRKRLERIQKKQTNNYVAEAIADAEFVLQWRKRNQKKA